MGNSLFYENKFSKATEVMFYILIPIVMYFDMKESQTVNLYGAALMLAGFISFLLAKISVIRKGSYFSFGCEHMTKKMMWAYFLGYVFMIAGYFVTFHLIIGYSYLFNFLN